MPASIGSNQASPANSVPSVFVVVLLSSMAWSPPALRRRKWLVEQARDYAATRFHHFRDCTGEAHDSTAFNDLMAENDTSPTVMLGDKGYDSDAIRDEVRARGGTPEIPTKKSRHIQHTVNRTLYAMRNRIERFFNRLKNSRRVATRYDQTARSILGFTKLASIRQWIRFVHVT